MNSCAKKNESRGGEGATARNWEARISLMIIFKAIQFHKQGLAVVGVIPLLIGAALLVYAYVLGPKD